MYDIHPIKDVSPTPAKFIKFYYKKEQAIACSLKNQIIYMLNEKYIYLFSNLLTNSHNPSTISLQIFSPISFVAFSGIPITPTLISSR